MSEERAGGEIEIAGASEPLRGYCSIPASGRGRGVLVVHEGGGLLDFTRDVCDRLAREGFAALAPDLYRGRRAADAAEASRLLMALESEGVGTDLDAAVQALLSSDAVEGARVGAVGFCMGGSLALLAATRNRRIGAVADFYGAHPSIQPDLSGLSASMLGIYAEHDEHVPGGNVAEHVERLRGQLETAGVRANLRVVPGVRHGFMNDTRPEVFAASASAESWDALLAFLRAELA